jgi:hypothetical protein
MIRDVPHLYSPMDNRRAGDQEALADSVEAVSSDRLMPALGIHTKTGC